MPADPIVVAAIKASLIRLTAAERDLAELRQRRVVGPPLIAAETRLLAAQDAIRMNAERWLLALLPDAEQREA